MSALGLAALLTFGLGSMGGTASAGAVDSVDASDQEQVPGEEYTSGSFRLAATWDASAGEHTFGMAQGRNTVATTSTIRVPEVFRTANPDDEQHAWIGPGDGEGFVLPGDIPQGTNPYNFQLESLAPAIANTATERIEFSIANLVSPSGGTYAGYNVGVERGTLAPPVDEQRFGTGVQANGEEQAASFTRSDAGRVYFAQRFTAEGLHCVTYRATLTPVGSNEPRSLDVTQRYAVGDAVAADAPCGGTPEEYPAEDQDPGEEPDEETVTISGVVWGDANRNGVRDAGEVPIEGANVSVQNGGRVTTDAEGRFAFSDLPPLENADDTYQVLAGNPRPGEWLYTTHGVQMTTVPLNEPGAEQTGMDFGFASPDEADPKRVLYWGHADVIYPEIDTAEDGSQSLELRAHADRLPQSNTLDWEDLVVVVGDHEKTTVVEGFEFMGPVGSEVWNSARASATPWIGMASQSPSLIEGLGRDAKLNFRLDAVTGADGADAPGDAVLWGGNEPNKPQMLFSTREGLPKAIPYEMSAHTHFNWTFSDPGVYCLAFTAEAEKPGGERLSDRGQLTLVVGNETNANAVTPCEESNEYPQAGSRTFHESDAEAPLVFGPGEFGRTQDDYLQRLLIDGDADRLDASLVYNTDAEDGRLTRASIDDVVLHGDALRPSRGEYLLGAVAVDSSETRGDTTGDITWRIADVRGPGEIRTQQIGFGWAAAENLDTAAGRNEASIWAGSATLGSEVYATRPGKYCVAMEWEAETAAGNTVTDSAVLTLAVDGPLDPQDARYDSAEGGYVNDGEVWRAAEQGALDATCEQDPDSWTKPDEVPDPNEEPGEPETPAWDVPNWTETDSGATILNLGHVDVASTLEQGALNTLVKDTTREGVEAGGPENGYTSWHEPEDTVLQLFPDAETPIPDAAWARTLGAAGAPMWLAPESQDSSILWPGWSTEEIPETELDGGVNWRLTGKEGPGEFALWTGAGDVHMSTADGIDENDQLEIPPRAHRHGNWAFTAEGTYCLAFERTATLPSGDPVSDEFTLAYAVGETDPTVIDPANCDDGSETTAPAAPAAPTASVDGGEVTVTWEAPASDGGSPITGYTVQLDGGDAPLSQETGADAATATFEDLPEGTYTATVIAVNSVGASEASLASNEVTVAGSGDEGPGEEDPPGEEEPGDQVSPVPDDQLTDANRGDVQVPDAAAPGQQITVSAPGGSGEQVRIWLHSAPVLLGTVTLNDDGEAVVTIPRDTEHGEHKIVVQALDGDLIGWDDIRIATASEVGPDGEDLVDTGSGSMLGWGLGAAGLILLAGATLAWSAARRSRRRQEEAEGMR